MLLPQHLSESYKQAEDDKCVGLMFLSMTSQICLEQRSCSRTDKHLWIGMETLGEDEAHSLPGWFQCQAFSLLPTP